jgi:hypothetical protein
MKSDSHGFAVAKGDTCYRICFYEFKPEHRLGKVPHTPIQPKKVKRIEVWSKDGHHTVCT